MSLPAWPPVPGIMLLYRWLEDVQLIDILTFNVESEFFSLFVHRFKRTESQDDLVVANMALRQQPWVAISCKTPPNSLDKKATREHEDEILKVKACLQRQHGFESQRECQWALVPPTNVDGFASGKILAVVRVRDTSDVRSMEEQRFNTMSFDEAQAKYTEIAGSLAANALRLANQYQN